MPEQGAEHRLGRVEQVILDELTHRGVLTPRELLVRAAFPALGSPDQARRTSAEAAVSRASRSLEPKGSGRSKAHGLPKRAAGATSPASPISTRRGASLPASIDSGETGRKTPITIAAELRVGGRARLGETLQEFGAGRGRCGPRCR